MEESGMTDLQFRSYVRKLLSRVDDAKEDSSKEELWEVLCKLRKDLEDDLNG